MEFNIITVFPNFYDGFLKSSLIGKAIDKGLLKINIIDLKTFGIGNYNKVDDKPYGGGSGMVIRVDVVDRALKSIKNPGYKILFEANGKIFTQKTAQNLSAKHKNITLICGRFEGFDSRVKTLVDQSISVGKYITMGGEAPSIILIESISRLVPGVIGNKESTVEESYSKKYILEYPSYTKPRNYNGLEVPEVLLNGDHKKIEEWKNTMGKIRI